MKVLSNGMKKISKANIELMTESLHESLILIKEIRNIYTINERNDKIMELEKIEQFYKDALSHIEVMRKNFYKA
jgi:hypothetical protein